MQHDLRISRFWKHFRLAAGRSGALARPLLLASLALATIAGSATSAGVAGRIELISKANHETGPTGGAPAGPSTLGNVSADGRYVVFASPATDLVPGQIDASYRPGDSFARGSWDIFLRDRATAKTTLVSHSNASPGTGGQIGNGNDDCFGAAVSADGNYAVFVCERRDLVAGQTPEGRRNVYLYDRARNASTLVSHRAGAPLESTYGFGFLSLPVISADGRFVAYSTDNDTVVAGPGNDDKIVLFDRTTGVNSFVDLAGAGLRMSAQGRFLVYYLDYQIFLYDRVAGTKTLVSHAAGSPSTAGNDQSYAPEISSDGSTVVYSSWATDLVPGQADSIRSNDLFLYERVARRTALVSHAASAPILAADVESAEPSLSADGRWIAFSSDGTDLVAGETDGNGRVDVFLYERDSGAITLVSHGAASPLGAASGQSLRPNISADGSRIAYFSTATDLVPGQPDTAPWSNFFVHDRASGTTTIVGRNSRVGLPVVPYLATAPRLSANGRAVAFGGAYGIVPADLNGDWDVYLYDDGAPLGPVPVAPCTLLDTRRAAEGPALRSNVRRVVQAAGACGVPATAKSVTVEVTALLGSGKGSLRFYPGNAAGSPTGSLTFKKGQTRTAAFTLPLASNGAGTLAVLPSVAGNGVVHAVVVVKGYTE